MSSVTCDDAMRVSRRRTQDLDKTKSEPLNFQALQSLVVVLQRAATRGRRNYDNPWDRSARVRVRGVGGGGGSIIPVVYLTCPSLDTMVGQHTQHPQYSFVPRIFPRGRGWGLSLGFGFS